LLNELNYLFRKIIPKNAFVRGMQKYHYFKKKFSWNARVFCWIILRYIMYLIYLILVVILQPYFSKMVLFKHNKSKKPNLYFGCRFTKIAITQPKIFKFEKFKNLCICLSLCYISNIKTDNVKIFPMPPFRLTPLICLNFLAVHYILI